MKTIVRTCSSCGLPLRSRHQIKFCSNKCQANFRFNSWATNWRKDEQVGGIGKTVRTTSKHIRKFLMQKYNQSCSDCGWNKIHPITHKVPLEIDHIDGNAENNKETNLRLLCPNCHALTPHFRNLNKGNGRKWRKLKYITS